MIFDIVDADGWLGVEAETLVAARRACEVLADEGYQLPLGIVPEGRLRPIVRLLERGENGSVWQALDIARPFLAIEGPRAAA